MKTIKLEDGSEVTTQAPAPNFNPLTASAAELVANGYPAISDEPHHRERFARLYGKLKHRLHYVEPKFKVNADRKHGPRHPVRAGTQTSGNWSGGVITAPAGQTFKTVQGDWVVPDVAAPTKGQAYYCATWVGIDGDGSPDVFQAGVETEVAATGAKTIYPWWEWYPTAEVQITNLPFSTGDMVTMVITSTQGAGSTKGTVNFINHTTGASTNVTLTAPTGTKLAGNCAEWIAEAPTVGGSQSAVADFGQVFFTVCEAVTASGTTVNGGTGDNINMTSGTKVVSDGVLVTPTIVECLYVGVVP